MEKRQSDFVAVWGRWSGKRELARGLLHASIGIIGWLLVHPLKADTDLITFLLFAVSAAFVILEGARLAVARWRNTDWYARFLKWINNQVVKKFLTRETEKHRQTTIVPSVLGLSLAWFIGDRWICAATALFFGLVDPLAKLGRYWPIKSFSKGKATGKSLGGLLFGFLGAVFAVIAILWTNSMVAVLPPGVSFGAAFTVFFVGAVAASFFELIGGKLDNFLIPAGSAAVMVALYKFFFN